MVQSDSAADDGILWGINAWQGRRLGGGARDKVAVMTLTVVAMTRKE